MDSKYIPLIAMLLNTDTGIIEIRIPPLSKEIYQQSYDLIGKHVEEIGKLIQQKKYPYFLNTGNYTHIVPRNDVITHITQSGNCECQCNPQVDVVKKTVYHISMDPSIPQYDIRRPNPLWEKKK